MDGDDLIARLAKSELFGGLDHELDQVVNTLEGWDLISNDTTGSVELLDNWHRD